MTIDYEVVIATAEPGEAIATDLFIDGMCDIWAERPELQNRTMTEWVEVYTKYINSQSRYELCVYDDGALVGVAIAVPQEDIHVGGCLDTVVMYVYPEYRTQGATRAILRGLYDLTASLNLNYLSTTQYKGNGTYVGKYHKVRK